MEGFWPGDNCRIIAVTDTFTWLNPYPIRLMLGKQADGEGMAFDLELRDRRFSCPEERKGLTRGTHIEADRLNP
jgi:hypothetical protein